jgi:hypothetical protein
MKSNTPLKKSHKALIITLVSAFVGLPLLLLVASLVLLPSVRMCSGVVRAGQEVVGELDKNFALLTYSYSCATGTPPTTKNQTVSTQLTSTKEFTSQADFRGAISSDLQTGGWVLVDSQDTEVVILSKNGFKTTVRSSSYQPALALVSVKPDNPSVNFGLVFEKTPALPRVLSEQDKKRFLTSPLYIPDYVPAGYTDWSVNTKLVDFYGNRLNGVNIQLNGGAGSVTPSLEITKIPTDYDIANGCDIFVSTTLPYVCDEIGVTSTGVKIYLPQKAKASGSPITYSSTLVAIIDDYLVFFHYAYQHPNVSPQLSVSEIVKVYNTLKSQNTPARL